VGTAPSSRPHAELQNEERRSKPEHVESKREADEDAEERNKLLTASSFGTLQSGLAREPSPVPVRNCSRDQNDHEQKKSEGNSQQPLPDGSWRQTAPDAHTLPKLEERREDPAQTMLPPRRRHRTRAYPEKHRAVEMRFQ
jgi:hypothetical protein